ncbi:MULTISPECIES: hypothetical protein [unclassified Streptomyces]|uniref:hypothetical protein n=1 Tax=unclassified Streptomyces TaxID=2593676 RepID=UPI00278BBA16|nr:MULTISPECIES: hypothetical protein [unclassified Streptomyces]
MPRPTVAQLAYGSATVVCSTIAMVLLSQTSSGPGIPVIAVSALILGLFVAMSVPTRKRGPKAESAVVASADAATAAATAGAASGERVPEQRLSATVSSPPSPASAEAARDAVREPAGP